MRDVVPAKVAQTYVTRLHNVNSTQYFNVILRFSSCLHLRNGRYIEEKFYAADEYLIRKGCQF